MKKHLLAMLVGIGMMGAVSVIPASAQQGGGGGGGGGRGGGGRGGRGGGGFNMQAFQQRQMDNMKTQMGATDDEWTVLQPKIQAVMTLQQADRQAAGGFGGRGRRGGGNNNANGGAAAPAADANPVATAAQDLRTLLEDKDATPDQIKAKLQALRDARTKAAAALAAAQKDLQAVTTIRQEAVLVSNGILE